LGRLYYFVHQAFVVLVEGVQQVSEEIVVRWKVLASQLDGLEVEHLNNE
jgi:hypothetical protein